MADIATAFLRQSRMVRFGAMIALGVFAGLGQAPFDLWFATLIGFAVVFGIYPAFANPRQAALHLWAFGFGYFSFCLRWIVEPFLVDIARHGWMAPFALMLMGAGAALFWGLAGWIATRIAPRRVMMLGLALVGVEALRSFILTGFPWALIGHIWVQTDLAHLAAWGGPHLLSGVTVLGAGALAALMGRGRIAGLVVLGLLVAVGFMVRPGAPMPETGQPVVRLVQPNAPQHQKWDPAFRDVFVNRLLRLSQQGDAPDLVVWPETAMPFLLNYIDDDLSLLSDAARGAPLVFGIQRLDEARRAYNSLVVMAPGGVVQTIYDKQHLVPFGEYIPGAHLLGRLGAAGLARNLGTGFTPGTLDGPVMLDGIGLAVPLICYEGIFAEEIRTHETRPRLLLLITNDAWFGQAAGPRQHLAQAQLRAIEHGLPMVRVANTGISAMIDPHGRITASLPMGVDGALDAALPAALPPTFYSRHGEWPFFALWLIFIILGHFGARRVKD